MSSQLRDNENLIQEEAKPFYFSNNSSKIIAEFFHCLPIDNPLSSW